MCYKAEKIKQNIVFKDKVNGMPKLSFLSCFYDFKTKTIAVNLIGDLSKELSLTLTL